MHPIDVCIVAQGNRRNQCHPSRRTRDNCHPVNWERESEIPSGILQRYWARKTIWAGKKLVTNSEQLRDIHIPLLTAKYAMFPYISHRKSVPGNDFSVFGFRNMTEFKIFTANHDTTPRPFGIICVTVKRASFNAPSWQKPSDPP